MASLPSGLGALRAETPIRCVLRWSLHLGGADCASHGPWERQGLLRRPSHAIMYCYNFELINLSKVWAKFLA